MGIKRIVGILSVALITGLGFWLYDPLPANPGSEVLSANAQNYKVEIIRDNWGTPHIYGKSDADAVFGLAYANAEDDFETIQLTVAAARGNLARYHGKAAAPTDYIVGLFEVWETISERYDTDIPENVKAIATAYADGLNLYAAQNPSQIWAGLAPFTSQDVIAGFVFKTPFFYGLDATLLELFGDERAQEIALDTSGKREAYHVGPKALVARGSNAIAVTGARSGDGVTRLLINSHQPMTGPVAWYEAHMVSEDGLNMTGGTFPGAPIILHGFNDHVGWANTVSAQDLADVYVLTLNPDNANQYKLDGEWVDFEVTMYPIKIKLFGPFTLSVKRKILRTQHGPVVRSKHGTYALRYAGMGEVRQLEQYYKLNRVESLDGFMNAMSMNALPSINYVYGDKDGNIAFVHNGQYPNRIEGWDWQKYLPGDRSELIWDGYRPFTDAPILINPQSGLIFNANNAPFSATDGTDNLTPQDFPKSMGLQTNQTNRSLRLIELTDGVSSIDKPALLALKFDHSYAENSQAADTVAKILAMDWSAEPQLAKAAEHLAGWDMSMSASSRHAALGGLTVMEAITSSLTHKAAPTPEAAFRAAVTYLMTHYGRIDPQWGALNRLVHGDVNLPIDGSADTLRAIYPQEFRDDGTLHAAAGDTWIALVEWNPEGQVSADIIHQFGSATLDTTSPHYSDQAEMFVQKKWRNALRDPALIREKAERIYRPQDQD